MSNLATIIEDHKGPPVNIEGIIRSLGIELDKNAHLADEIAGQIELLENGRYRISVNKKDHYYRKRFTMAHELGHFLFHSHLISDGVDDTRAYRSTPDGKFYNRLIGSPQETEANQFAAAILMPADSVREAWNENPDLDDLAKRFQVSRQAMQIRIRGLQLEK